MKSSTLCMLICLCAFVLSAQEQKATNDSEALGDQYGAQGIQYFQTGQIDSAVIQINASCTSYKQAKTWEKYVCMLNNLAYVYHYDKRLGNDLKEIVLEAYNISNTKLKSSSACLQQAYSNLGDHYYSIGDYEKAIEILNEVVELNIKNQSSKLDLATSYSNLGVYHEFSGDYQNAFSFFKKALQLRQDSIFDNPGIADTYQDIGRVFQSNNQIDSAIVYLQKAEQLLLKDGSNDLLIKKKLNNFFWLARLQNQKGNYPAADHYINKTKQFDLDNYYQVMLQETMGKIYLSQKKYTESIAAFEKAQAVSIKHDKRNTPTHRAKRLIDLADAYYSNNNYNKALSVYQNALISLAPNFETTHYSTNPKANKILGKPDALKIFNGKAKTLFELFSKTNDPKYLQAAYATYLIATNLIRDMRQGFLNPEAKNALAERSVLIYEGAIQTAIQLYQQTKDDKYKSAALALAESNKALLLLESINEQNAKNFADIPKHLIEKEKTLKLSLAFLQKKLLEHGSAKNIADAIFEQQQQLNQLTAELEANYPRYFKLKYLNDPVSLPEIQARLHNNAMLEFFVGEEAIYLFVVTARTLDIHTITNISDVFAHIKQLRNVLSLPPGTQEAQTEYELFTSSAQGLYKALLQPALKQLPDNINKLTIIPDYQINYIPFEVLVTKTSEVKATSYSSSLSYLMEEYAINYHYSATLLDRSQDKKKVDYQYDFTGYAPVFRTGATIASRACSADELYSLTCSEEEVQSINKLFNGQAFLAKQADLNSFKSTSGNSRIIHLATHACIDETNSNVNKIFLTDDYLSNYDLYNLNLNAELAVLSACNTGSGELIKGEGAMSLARGFINAGCSSTLMSMWSVDDCATSDIMLRFYKGLKKGETKDEALRGAKLSYLKETSKSKSHPYYWAAFVQFGDVSAMEVNIDFPSMYLFGGLGLLLVLFFFLKRR